MLRLACVPLLVALLALAGCVQAQNPEPDVYWFEQKFDHFSVDSNVTFKQRYLIFDKAYLRGSTSPIFFCPGGESDVMGGYEHNGFMFEFGIPIGALFIFPEHRFYGQSVPFGQDSYNADNIKKLTIQQALQDYITILQYVRDAWDVTPDSPVVAFGGSYPGELASFLRFEFPDQIDAAHASSAPLLWHPGVQPGVASGAFFQVATADFAVADAACPDLMRAALAEVQALAATAQGRATMAARLRLCAPLQDGPDALSLFFLWAENAFADIGMMNYPYATGGLPAWPMQASCRALSTATPQTLLERLADALEVGYNSTGSEPCFNITSEYYPCADITGCGAPGFDAYSWDYQSCTEIVSNVDTNNVTDMFPPAPYSYDDIVAYCQKTWNTTPTPLAIPTRFNMTAESASNIIFTNGLADPWWPGGILENLSDTLLAIKIPKSAHHLDLRGSNPADPEEVTVAREYIKNVLFEWIIDARQDRRARMARRA